MKSITVLLLCCQFSSIVFGQTDYKKAVIHKRSGDTLQCLVKDREWLENPTSITIRTMPGNTTQQLNISDIKKIIIENGDHYQAATVKIDLTPTEFQTPYIDPQLVKFDETLVLLQVEYSASPFTLLSLRRSGRFYLYIQKNDAAPQLLIYRKVSLLRDGVPFEAEDNTFISQLADLFEGCTKALNKTANTNYSTGRIIDIFNLYNQECGGRSAQYSNEHRMSGKMGILLIGGISLNRPVFTGSNGFTGSPLISSNPMKANPSFSGGLRMHYLLPRVHQHMAFLLDLLYNSYTATVTENKSFTSNDLYTKKTLTIHPALIKTALMAKYYLTKGKGPVRPFLQAGFAGGLTISHKESVVQDDYYSGQSHITTANPYDGIVYKKTQLGFTGGAGIEYKRLSADYRYERVTGTASTLSMGSQVTTHSLLLGFRINK